MQKDHKAASDQRVKAFLKGLATKIIQQMLETS